MPPRLAPLLAVVAAVVVVVGAFVVRGALSGDDGDRVSTDGPGTTSDGTSPGRADDVFQVLCDDDLGEEVCDLIEGSDAVDEVRVVRRSQVAGVLADPESDVEWDAWLTLDPMPAVLDFQRRQVEQMAPLTHADAVVAVASSDLAVLTFEGTKLTCDAPVTWDCLAQPVSPGVAVADPSTSVGAITAAAAAVGLHGETDFGFDRFMASDAGPALVGLFDASPAAAGRTTAEQTAALYQPGRASAAVTTTDLADLRGDTSQGRGRGFRTLALSSRATVGVVLAGLGPQAIHATRALTDLVGGKDVLDALAAAGWAGPPVPTTGLPAPDLIYAIVEDLS